MRFLFLSLLAFTPGWSFSQKTGPRFHIESFRVVNSGSTPPETVISSALLVAGTTYSERDLKEALHRIKRLPFVYDCELSLEKGSERGKYVLVISVDETWKFSLGLFGYRLQDGLRLSRALDSMDFSTQISYRLFSGENSLIYASYGVGIDGDRDYGGNFFNLGFNHYQLFGRNVFANVNATHILGDFEASDPAMTTVSVQLAAPFPKNQWLKWSAYGAQTEEYDSRVIIRNGMFNTVNNQNRFKDFGFELGWEYNTTDDQLTPTTGTRISGALAFTRQEWDWQPWEGHEALSRKWQTREVSVSLEGVWHWDPDFYGFFGFGGGIGVKGFDDDLQEAPTIYRNRGNRLSDLSRFNGHAEVTYAMPLLQRRFRSKNHFLLELGTAVDYNQSDGGRVPDLVADDTFFARDRSRLFFSFGVTYRARWMYLNLNLFYDMTLADSFDVEAFQ